MRPLGVKYFVLIWIKGFGEPKMKISKSHKKISRFFLLPLKINPYERQNPHRKTYKTKNEKRWAN